jgi:hypothetical protein
VASSAALESGDLTALLALLQEGLASADHTAFVEKLTAAADERQR